MRLYLMILILAVLLIPQPAAATGKDVPHVRNGATPRDGVHHTNLRELWRVGGDLDLLKRFIAAGFPVLVEKGFEGAGFDGWMGHYEVLNGYDDSRQRFIAQDSFIMENLPVSY